MSTDKNDPKNRSEVPAKDGKPELTDDELSKVTGGSKHIGGVKYEDGSTTSPQRP